MKKIISLKPARKGADSQPGQMPAAAKPVQMISPHGSKAVSENLVGEEAATGDARK